MKITKRTIVFALAALMTLGACLWAAQAQGTENAYPAPEEAYVVTAGAYDRIGGKLIRNADGTVADPGFTAVTDEYGGVRIESPAQTEGAVVYTSAITSKAKTSLDGLTVTIKPDQFDFTKDEAGRSSICREPPPF